MRTLADSIVDGVKDLTQRQQVEVLNLVFRLNPRLQKEQADMLRRTRGAWIDDEPVPESTPEEGCLVESNGR